MYVSIACLPTYLHTVSSIMHGWVSAPTMGIEDGVDATGGDEGALDLMMTIAEQGVVCSGLGQQHLDLLLVVGSRRRRMMMVG